MIYTERSIVEGFIIQELQKLGWKYVPPDEMRRRRNFEFDIPIVKEDLKRALRRVNRDVELTDRDIDHILTRLTTFPRTIDGVKEFLDVLKNGIPMTLESGEEKVIKIIDFDNPENNEFVVTNQYKVEGTEGNIRADVVLLINGIPIVLIECKSPTREDVDWTHAYRQIKRYEREAPDLFIYVQFSIATDGIKTYYFPNSFREEGKDFLSVWRDPYPFSKRDVGDDDLRTTIYGLLSKNNLLDMLENFIFIRREGSTLTKIMARYMQFRATNRIVERVVKTLKGEENKRFGLIWHWQGSGKTYTMAFVARKLLLHPATEHPSIFVVVDRKELEEQIEDSFSQIGISIRRIQSIRELINVLTRGREGERGIFLVTIEKFRRKEFEELRKRGIDIQISRRNVIVLADEVHRTHYGIFSALMRSVFKNAFFFGFTGTPLSKVERNTFQKFCPPGELYLDRYSMLDSMQDGFTIRLSYQARLPHYHLNREQLENLRRFESEEIESLSDEEKRLLRRKVRVIKNILKNEERIRSIARDIASHFKEMVEETGLKAMVVAVDREACVLYKRALDEFLPSEYSEIIMTFNSDDKGIVREYYDEFMEKYRRKYGVKNLKEIHKRIIDEFKESDFPKILIVTSMLITGFDAPRLWTMYLDKPLREHGLLQTIARTNRPFKNKEFGLIIDYIGVLDELEEAFKKFEAQDERLLRVVIRNLEVERREFVSLLQEILRLFGDIEIKDTRESLDSVLDVLKLNPDKAKLFEEKMRRLMKLYEMLKGEPFLNDYLSAYTMLVKIYIAYNKKVKRKNVDELKIDELSRKTNALIRKSIDVKEIDDRYKVVEIDTNYINALKHKKPRTVGAAIDIINDIRYEIRMHPRSPFFMNLSEEVEKVYELLKQRRIRVEEAIRRLLNIAAEIDEWKRKREELGKGVHAIMEAIMTVLSGLISEEEATAFAKELIRDLENKKLIFKGWRKQKGVFKRVKGEVRIKLLIRFKDFRDKLDELLERIMDALEETE